MQGIEEVPQILYESLEKIVWFVMVSVRRSIVIVTMVRSFVVAVNLLLSELMQDNYPVLQVLFPDV